MTRPLLLTGFEPFLDVRVNPSGEVARRLDGSELAGGDVRVVGRELPVTFEGAPHAFHGAFEALLTEPVAIVSLGVHRGAAFRLERRARSTFASGQPDNDGRTGEGVRLEGPEERVTAFDLDECSAWLQESGAAEVIHSDDAGGYLCERVYRAGLDTAARVGTPALFLHVPPIEFVAVDDQERVVRGFLERLGASVLGE